MRVGAYKLQLLGFLWGQNQRHWRQGLLSLLSCMMVVGEQQAGEKSSQVLVMGQAAGGSRPVGPVLSILTACSPLLGSREADLWTGRPIPLGEGGPPGQSPLCL